jgi:hypothetical protein
LLSRGANHDEARRVAEAAVSLAGHTDLLVDHGDACLTLATILGAAGDVAGERAAAERAIDLYERKGAAALAEKARRILSERSAAPVSPQAPSIEPTNACLQAGSQLIDAVNREAWQEVTELLAPYISVESRRKIVGFPRIDVPSSQWPKDMRHFLDTGMVRYRHASVAVRGERLALTRLVIGTADLSSDAPRDELLHLAGLDAEGRIALQVWFDVEDVDAAMVELEAAHARFEEVQPKARRLKNVASQVYDRVQAHFGARDLDAMAAMLADDFLSDDHRRVVNAGTRRGRDAAVQDAHANADLGVKEATSTVIATRGERLVLRRARYSGRAATPEAFHIDVLNVVEVDADERVTAIVDFDLDDFDAAIAELDARYAAGEAAPYAQTWSVIGQGYASLNRRELPAMTSDFVSIDHRRGAAFAPGDLIAYIRAGWDLNERISTYVGTVHRINNLGCVVTREGRGTSQDGFDAEWRTIDMLTVEGDLASRFEVFDEADLDAALERFDQLNLSATRLENAASRAFDRYLERVVAQDWDTLAELLADDYYTNDRRHLVGGGIYGRDAEIASVQVQANLGVTHAAATVIAVRGDRLAFSRVRYSARDQDLDVFLTEILVVLEINADNRFTAAVAFDLDDFDAAIAELDALYIAGEGAAHARTWSAM